MLLRKLVDHRLNPLLLIVREIEVPEPLHNTALNLGGAWRCALAALALLRLPGRILSLLRTGGNRQCERRSQNARR